MNGFRRSDQRSTWGSVPFPYKANKARVNRKMLENPGGKKGGKQEKDGQSAFTAYDIAQLLIAQ